MPRGLRDAAMIDSGDEVAQLAKRVVWRTCSSQGLDRIIAPLEGFMFRAVRLAYNRVCTNYDLLKSDYRKSVSETRRAKLAKAPLRLTMQRNMHLYQWFT